MIPIFHSENPLSFESIRALEVSSITTDWYGQKHNHGPKFVLAADLNCLWFLAEGESPVVYSKDLAVGEFAEGLWKNDCAELFVCEDGTARYQEFNLSPGGAWWSCLFSSYRKADEQAFVMSKGVQCFAEVSPSHWISAMSIPRNELSVKISFTEESRLNVSFILETPQQKFLSWAKLKAEQPDFHVSEQYEAIKLTEIKR